MQVFVFFGLELGDFSQQVLGIGGFGYYYGQYVVFGFEGQCGLGQQIGIGRIVYGGRLEMYICFGQVFFWVKRYQDWEDWFGLDLI